MAKAWKVNDPAQPSFPITYKTTKRWAGNCTILNSNSNKFYHSELQVALNGQARIYTEYGRVGKTKAANYRYFNSETQGEVEYNKLVNKKKNRKKDPYVEVELAITAVGSDGAKDIKKAMTGINIDKEKVIKSNLHSEVQRLVGSWFGSTGTFIEMTLKCPLGQLTKEQIDKGRAVLTECQKRINAGVSTSLQEYDNLTSKFYSLIPHVLPHKINADNLRIDDLTKVVEKNDTLDTFLDAKNVSSVLSDGSSIDARYKTLKANIDIVEPMSPEYKWLEQIVHGTRASNHRWLGKMKIHNIFKLQRNHEYDLFTNRAVSIAAQRRQNTWTWPNMLARFGPERTDLSKEELELYKRANIIPLFHGTRNENMIGITTKGLLIRPSGAVHTGSMYGDGCYFGFSSKALNYSSCRGTYWARGNHDRGYLFMVDVCLGDPLIAGRSSYYTAKNISPKHCAWAKAGGSSGLINDEFITYHPSGKLQQHNLRYIIEIETQAK